VSRDDEPRARDLATALAGARPVQAIGYVIDLDGVMRLALTPTEAGPLLGLSAAQICELCKAGQLRSRNMRPGSRGGRYLIPVIALVEWLNGRDGPVPSAYG